jgi:carbonic anhydrase
MSTATKTPPKTNLAGLRDHWRNDLIAGFSVALVALPLGLGIATAAGAPPISGLVSVIVAGLVATFLRGSHVAINGPGNSLIVIIAGAYAAFGGGEDVFPHVLGAVIVAGGVQMLLGLSRLGKLGDIVPPAVIQGLLAAIGLIIIGKQAHVLFGREPLGDGSIEVLQRVPESIVSAHPTATAIGLISLLVLIAHPRIKAKFVHFVPAPLWVVAFAIPLGMLFQAYGSEIGAAIGTSTEMDAGLFVSIPSDLIGSLTQPSFAKIAEPGFWGVVLTLCLVTSIENIVSVKAVDKLDSYGRRSNLNRDLVAMGATTIASGFLGGLPVLTVIARSSVNVNHGAKTGWSNFFQGALLLAFVFLLPAAIKEIALAALAAILVYTGYKLTSPTVISDTVRKGPDHFIVFGITVVATLVWGLLWGLAVGLAAELLGHLLILGLRPRDALRRLRGTSIEPLEDPDGGVVLRVRGIANFLNVLRVRRSLNDLPEDEKVIIDFGPAMLVDNAVLEQVHDFGWRYEKTSEEAGFEVIGLEAHRALSDHPDALHAQERKLHLLRLTPRQRRFSEKADEEGWDFDARRDWDPGHLIDFHFFQAHPIEFSDTFVHGALEVDDAEVDFTLCDVTFDEGVIVGEVYHTTTLMLHLPFEVPEFILEKEGILDRAFALAGFQDIDFKHFTKFSRRFVLKGPDERAIRELMTPELLEFFEHEDVYHIECAGRELVIFETFMRRATVSEVAAMVEFAERLLERLLDYADVVPTVSTIPAAPEDEEAAETA